MSDQRHVETFMGGEDEATFMASTLRVAVRHREVLEKMNSSKISKFYGSI